MPQIVYAGESYSALEGESVLDCLLRHGITIAHACRAGVCQSCLLMAKGPVPAAAQVGLKPTLKHQGGVLSCLCPAEDGLELSLGDAVIAYPARVVAAERLTATVHRVWLETAIPIAYEAGQFVQVVRPHDGLTRAYSIASLPGSPALELHVATVEHGAMSNWLCGAVGESVELRGPAGSCFYVGGQAEQPLLLVGTGTGLAPLLGITRAALAAGHTGPIRLYHASRESSGLYLYDALRQLEHQHTNVSFVACVRDDDRPGREVRLGMLEDTVLADHASAQGTRVFLCGNPLVVRTLRKKLFMAGASMREIFSDPFVIAPPQQGLLVERSST